MLNSYEELCITLGAADNSFARVLNPHRGAYIYILERLPPPRQLYITEEGLRSIVAEVMNFDIVNSEFELQPLYLVHFRTNSLGKGMYLLSPPSMD